MNRTLSIGFSQRIQLEWLERTADLIRAGKEREEIKLALEEMLRARLSVGSNPKRGNRDKVVSILLRTWVSVPKHLEALRDDGLRYLEDLPLDTHLAVHWGMAMAVYPFFGVVAETAGRLLRLQGSVVAAQVQRRLREQLGERDTVARSARRVLRCFVDWGVLRDTSASGVYEGTTPCHVQDRELSVWLLEACLVAGGTGSRPLSALVRSPSLFPFDLGQVNPLDLDVSPRLEFLRQGLDEDVVMLRRVVHPRAKEGIDTRDARR